MKLEQEYNGYLICLIDVLSQGRNLSPVTDKLWKKFFEKQFGTNSTDEVIKRMKEKRVSFRWMQLFEVTFFLFALLF